jgi:hypothetical protein
MQDQTQKITLLVKEMKVSAQVVKLGEKQIENIIEKMDAFKSENFKFKTSMKQKFYDGEKRFNENKVVVETELHRLKRKVETQIEEQQAEFNKTISECKVRLSCGYSCRTR